MSERAQSRNWEVDIGGQVVYPIKLGDFAPGGVAGMLETTDGRDTYSVLSQNVKFDTVDMDVQITEGKRDYDIMEEFAGSAKVRDVFVRARDAQGKVSQSFMFSECQCARDKMNGFDPKSKTQDMRKYHLLPKTIEEIK